MTSNSPYLLGPYLTIFLLPSGAVWCQIFVWRPAGNIFEFLYQANIKILDVLSVGKGTKTVLY